MSKRHTIKVEPGEGIKTLVVDRELSTEPDEGAMWLVTAYNGSRAFETGPWDWTIVKQQPADTPDEAWDQFETMVLDGVKEILAQMKAEL